MDERQLARALGWFSLGLGLTELVAPRQLSRAIGLRDRDDLVRLFGLREIASGIGLLNGQRPDRWVRARVAGDVMDLALVGTALTADNPRRNAAAVATAAVAGATVLDVLCSRHLEAGAGALEGPWHVERSITIDRPAADLYQFWRRSENLPRIMPRLVSAREYAPNRSHWTMRGPAGTRLKWDSEITRDEPNTLIAWCSLEGADVDNAGVVRFEPAPGVTFADAGKLRRPGLPSRPPVAASIQPLRR